MTDNPIIVFGWFLLIFSIGVGFTAINEHYLHFGPGLVDMIQIAIIVISLGILGSPIWRGVQ